MADDPPPPSLLWRAGSTAVMGFVGTLTRAFMHGPNWQDAHGLDGFLELLDERADIDGRKRGLITGMQHQAIDVASTLTDASKYRITSACTYVSRKQTTTPHPSTSSQTSRSSIDDPLTWGVLPLRYHFNPSNHRWSLGSYDIVFKNKYATPSPLKLPPIKT